jgi:integrase
MPKSAKKDLDRQAGRKKQQHVRFSIQKISTAPDEEIRKDLVKSSVSAGSNKTYGSALKTLSSFLKEIRGSAQPLESMRQDEFIRFLQSCKDQNMSHAETYRSALIKHQLAKGIPTWAQSPEILALTKAVGHNHISTPKGVITPAQCKDLCKLICSSKSYFVDPCSTCWNATPKVFNRDLSLRLKLQWMALLRPGELEKLKKKDLIRSLHHSSRSLRRDSLQEPGESMVVPQLIFTSKKNIKDSGAYMISEPAAEIFEMLTKDLQPDDYIVPRCADKHIGEAVRKAASDLQWSDAVVWCAHALRKSVLTDLADAILKPTEAFCSGIASNTLHGFYATKI